MAIGRVSEVKYLCPVCNTWYTPLEAAEVGHFCHVRLERVVEEAGSPLDVLRRADVEVRVAEPYHRLDPFDGYTTIQAIPPAQNEVDPTVVEQVLGSFADGPLALELVGDSDGQRMFVRGPISIVHHAQLQLQAGYGQVAFDNVSEEQDPVYAGEGFLASSACSLRRPEFFPIKTWRQFGGEDSLQQTGYQGKGTAKAADPMRVLVGALDGLAEGERGLAQLVLRRRAPEDWADRYQGSAQETDFRMKAASPAGQARGAMMAGAIVLGFLDLVFLCQAVVMVVRYGVFSRQSFFPLAFVAFLVLVNVASGYGLSRGWRRLTTVLSANPQVVRQKVSQPAFHAQLRFFAWAKTPERAQEILKRLQSAYAVFALAEGNAFVSNGARPIHPALLDRPEPVKDFILNLTEIAGLWHMPLGELPERMKRQMFFRRTPQVLTDATPGSVELGRSTKGGEKVYLPAKAVEGGIFMDGKPQVGKSTTMEFIASAAMQDPSRAVVVIDPHQDMVHKLMALVPPDRVEDVWCLDMAEEEVFPGINLLDMTMGASVDKVVSDLIVIGQALWSDYWGPRMEQIMRYAARTIALINRRRVAIGRPDEQLTILFIPRLLLSDSKKRKAYLMANLPSVSDVDVKDVLWWWNDYYDQTSDYLLQQVISPVITKLFHISGVKVLQRVFGQPRTTIDFRRAIANRGIVLVNSGGALLGAEVGAFVGSLVVNYIDTVVREQGALPRDQRVEMTVVVDEFQSIRGAVSWRDILGQLRKFGAHVVLGTQSLAGIREDNPQMPGEILAGVMTTLVYQVNAEDALYLENELDMSVPPTSMTNLSPYHVYVKTIGPDRKRLPVMEVRLRDPLIGDPTAFRLVRQKMGRYAVSAIEADAFVRQMTEEPIDEYDAALSAKTQMITQITDGKQVISTKDLLTAVQAMGTRSSQSYSPKSGAIGRGLSTRRKKQEQRRTRPGRIKYETTA